MPQKGDLVLLRQFVIDKEKGRKLEPRWEGPYLLVKVAKEGVSGFLQDLKTGKVKGKYAFDAMKTYVPREVKAVGLMERLVDLEEGLSKLCHGWYTDRGGVDMASWK